MKQMMMTPPILEHDTTIDVCNRLLRGEISAVETYDLALDKFAGMPEAEPLRSIREEHRASVERLNLMVISSGGTPENGSGAWGLFASGVQSAANLMGEESAVASLRKGEQHGQSESRKALEDDGVSDPCRTMIQEELLPRVNDHLRYLDVVAQSS